MVVSAWNCISWRVLCCEWAKLEALGPGAGGNLGPNLVVNSLLDVETLGAG